MNEEWVPLDDWWTLVKMGSKSRSFIKKFEKELNKKGFTIDRNKSKAAKVGSHMKLAIIENETGTVKMATITPEDKGKAVKNAVAQVVGIFSGRKRRGQGSFRLDDNVESADMEKLGPLGAFAVGVGAQAGKTIMEEKSDDGEVEKLNFRDAFSQLSEGINYKNAVEGLDGGAKPTPVPKNAEASFNKLRRKP